MSIVNALLQQANEVAELSQDMTVATTGGGGGRLYPEGYAFARLVEVVEVGSHRIEYQGKLKDASPQFRLGFALWGEGYQEDDGTPGIIRTYEIALSANEKAKAFKLFKKLNYKGTSKTFAQLLNETYLLKVVHSKPKDATQKPRAQIDLEGFLPPTDPVTKAPYNIPQAPDDMFKLFLWLKPTKPMWDSLFVEGKYDDGVSKNFIQERCLAATDYPGSALETLLGGGVGALPSITVPSVPAQPAAIPSGVAPDDASVPFDGGVPTTLPQAPAMQVPPAVAVPAVPNGVPSIPSIPNVPAVG